jgi:FkbM family methyltransferase
VSTENLLIRYLEELKTRPAIFVNVGAHTGKPYENGVGDPIVSYVQACPWQGVSIEPDEQNFSLLEKKFGASEHNTLINAAVSDFDGEIEMFSVSQENTGWSFSSEIGTTVPDRGWMAKAIDKATVTKVPCYTLQTIIERMGFQRCDVLKIDTEGAEAKILFKFFSDPPLLPSLIYYEHRHLTEQERQELKELLSKFGYEVFEQNHPLDTLAINKKTFGVFSWSDRLCNLLRHFWLGFRPKK